MCWSFFLLEVLLIACAPLWIPFHISFPHVSPVFLSFCRLLCATSVKLVQTGATMSSFGLAGMWVPGDVYGGWTQAPMGNQNDVQVFAQKIISMDRIRTQNSKGTIMYNHGIIHVHGSLSTHDWHTLPLWYLLIHTKQQSWMKFSQVKGTSGRRDLSQKC